MQASGSRSDPRVIAFPPEATTPVTTGTEYMKYSDIKKGHVKGKPLLLNDTRSLTATLTESKASPSKKATSSANTSTLTHDNSVESLVQGSMRFRYFTHVPSSSQPPTQSLTNPSEEKEESLDASFSDNKSSLEVNEEDMIDFPEEGLRSIAIQTMYRDSEAQTDPYSPDVIIPEGTDPELARLKFLHHGGKAGESLRAGKADVDAVLRLRDVTYIEKNLPPVTDNAGMSLRKKIMVAMEVENFANHEAEIDDVIDQKMFYAHQSIVARAADRSFVAEQRLEDIRRKLQAELEVSRQNIEAKRVKVIRKVVKNRERAEYEMDMLTGTGCFTGVAPLNSKLGAKQPQLMRKPRRDIISEYADFSSKVYAPLTRDGLAVKSSTKVDASSGNDIPFSSTSSALIASSMGGPLPLPLLNTIGLQTGMLPPSAQSLSLTASGGLPLLSTTVPSATLLTSSLPNPEEVSNHTRSAQSEAQFQDALKTVHQSIIWSKSDDDPRLRTDPVPEWRFIQRKLERAPTAAWFTDETTVVPGTTGSRFAGSSFSNSSPLPLTPTAEGAVDGADTSFTQAVSLLQMLVRGLATRHTMEEGKKRRLNLLAEMSYDLMAEAAVDRQARSNTQTSQHSISQQQDGPPQEEAVVGLLGSMLQELAAGLAGAEEATRAAFAEARVTAIRGRREARLGAAAARATASARLAALTASATEKAHNDSAEVLLARLLLAASDSHAHLAAAERTGLAADRMKDIIRMEERKARQLEEQIMRGVVCKDGGADHAAAHAVAAEVEALVDELAEPMGVDIMSSPVAPAAPTSRRNEDGDSERPPQNVRDETDELPGNLNFQNSRFNPVSHLLLAAGDPREAEDQRRNVTLDEEGHIPSELDVSLTRTADTLDSFQYSHPSNMNDDELFLMSPMAPAPSDLQEALPSSQSLTLSPGGMLDLERADSGFSADVRAAGTDGNDSFAAISPPESPNMTYDANLDGDITAVPTLALTSSTLASSTLDGTPESEVAEDHHFVADAESSEAHARENIDDAKVDEIAYEVGNSASFDEGAN